MKDIKLKLEGGRPRLLDSAARVPKTAMKDVWLKSRQKAVEEAKETPFAGQRGESSNSPANSAGEQILSGAEGIAGRGANLTRRSGRKLAQSVARSVKSQSQVAVKTTSRTVKGAGQAARSVKAAQTARAAAKAAATSIKAAAKATVVAVKSTIAAIKGLGAIIAAGGWVAVLIIVIICAVTMIVGARVGSFGEEGALAFM